MGVYDTFVDEERKRETQTKAFLNDYPDGMRTFTHTANSNPIVGSLQNFRTYYVETLSYGYFIRIEGEQFTGIVTVLEDNIFNTAFRYPIFDYSGKIWNVDKKTEEMLEKFAICYKILENSPERYLKRFRKENMFKVHVSNRISGRDIWKKF